MLDLLEKSFVLGLGALSVTKNTAEKFVNEAIKQCKITPEEGKSFLKTFEEEGEKARKSIEETVEKVVRERGASLLPWKKELDALEARIAALEAKLAESKGEGKDA